MANLGMSFDAGAVEPTAPMEVIPPGKYEVQIVKSENKLTKDGSGQFLFLEFDILSGAYQGKKLWDRLNLINNNQTAVEIAQRTLSAICRAVGVMVVNDSEQLHCIPLIAEVKVIPAGPDKSGVYREAQNQIKSYSAYGALGAQTTGPTTMAGTRQMGPAGPLPPVTMPPINQAARPPSATAAASPGKMPWAR